MNNENEELSRNMKRRIKQKNERDDKTKSLINEIKSEKKKKTKNIDKIKNLKIELVKIKYADKPNLLENALKELNKIEVIDKTLHEIKNEILGEYNGGFEMVYLRF